MTDVLNCSYFWFFLTIKSLITSFWIFSQPVHNLSTFLSQFIQTMRKNEIFGVNFVEFNWFKAQLGVSCLTAWKYNATKEIGQNKQTRYCSLISNLQLWPHITYDNRYSFRGHSTNIWHFFGKVYYPHLTPSVTFHF